MHVLTRSGRLKILAMTGAAAVTTLVSGCGGAPSHEPNYIEVRLEANAPNLDECHEAVAIRFEPVDVALQPRGSLYETATYTDQPLIVGKPVNDGANNWECWFTYHSRDLAPGTWRIVGEFSDGSISCVRDIKLGTEDRVRIDQEDGCVEFDGEGPSEPTAGGS